MNVKYVIKEGIAGIQRTKLAASTSIFSLFIAILLLGILARVSFNLYDTAMSIKDLITIEVFLFDVDQRTLVDLENRLNELELVEDVTYISKDSASVIAQQEMGIGVEDLIALNFLPASFQLKVNSDAGADQVDQLVSSIRNYRGVDEIRYNANLIRVMESNLNVLTLGGGGLGLLILLAAVILVYNTIRLTIYAKRDLIRAMKLVGATNGFIRSPFIVEGVLQGIIAGVAAVGCIFILFEFVVPLYLPDFGILEWPYGRWYYLVGAMMLLALMMGWWGSRWAARRFIEETYISS